MLQALIKAFSKDTDFGSLTAGIEAGMKEQLVSGLSGSSRQIMLAALHEQTQRPLLVVTHNMFSAQKIADDLQEALSSNQVLLYPANELVAAESAISGPETLSQRIDVLLKASQGFRGIIVVPYSGVRKLLPAPEAMAGAGIQVQLGGTLRLEAFLTKMIELGYERVERVESRGEMSVRGGIIDFYPLMSPTGLAYRIELFDEDVDSIRVFDPADQRSVEQVKDIFITPCKELIADAERLERAAEQVDRKLSAQLEKMTDRQAKSLLQGEISREMEMLREHVYFADIYKYISLIYPEQKTLFDYMSEDTLLILDEPARLLETAKQLERDEAEWNLHLFQNGKSLPELPLSVHSDKVLYHRPFQTLFLSIFLRQVPHTQPQNILNFVTRGMQDFHGQMNVLKSEMERWKKSGAEIIMLASTAERKDRMIRVLEDYSIPEPAILQGNLQTGFELPAAHLVVITEGEMFSQKQRKVRKGGRSMDNAERIKSYTELKVGDYVVHQNHGIGKYMGIGTLEINGIHKDYMHILYAGGDKLSVPIDQIDLIQKYVGSEDKEPKVYKLGGNEWTRVKNKVRSSVEDIADDLIKLYAERQAT
ncbi:hypothetical protein GCM10010917_40360 [Paenibacillus physcomitrellae]|uniref:CarD-like/TRCF RNAP-interacting domain-containing protein n=1 Tax=Paenibacillus physcomitrellae TaxID=1619311 RepID=A0ABQ1GVT2_9BACL|nr:hypothetical protein GCM10010917_40360 [Paenibacillus physcomitrellae]